MDLTEAGSSEDLWSPFKDLASTVEHYLGRERAEPYTAFEACLRRHRQSFLSLLKNPTKNATHREEIKRGVSEGVNLPNVGHTVISKELVDETIIVSDMYNVNEYLALELLLTAQRQLPRHPGLPRGLVAVLLYYDGRKALVQALKELMVARKGVSWSVEAPQEVITYVTRYTDRLISEGLLERVIDCLDSLDLAAELNLLQANRALGGPKHYRQVVDMFEDIRRILSEIVFAASAQRGLSRDTLLRLLRRKESTGSSSTGAPDDVSLALQMAVLYATDLSLLHRREDGEELAKSLPLITDADLLATLIKELEPADIGEQSLEQSQPSLKNSSGVRSVCQLSLGLALAALKRAPHSLLHGNAGSLGRPQIDTELLDQDELLVDAAIDGNVFEYIQEVLLANEQFSKQEYYMKRAHGLVTDFVVLMYSKLMDLRLKADEEARAIQLYAAEGLTHPSIANGEDGRPVHRGHFASLLRLVENLYKDDVYELRNDYWVAADPKHAHAYRSGGRAVTLFKFVRLAGELLAPPLLAWYLRALASLSVRHHTFRLLAQRRDCAPASRPAVSTVSWDHLLGAMYRYYCNLRQDQTPYSLQHSSSMGASAIAGVPRGRRLVRQEEVEALVAALQLVRSVAAVDPDACTAICEHPQWDAVNTMFGLVGCHVPIELKSELILCLSCLGGTAATAARVWNCLEASQLIRTVPTTQQYTIAAGLQAELEEVESRNEEYPLSRAFLRLLRSLWEAGGAPHTLGAGARAPGLDPYVTHAARSIALPAPHRAYTHSREKWQVLSLALDLFVRWLEPYEASPGDFPAAGGSADVNPPPGFHVALQMHTKSDFLRLVLSVLDEGVRLLDSYQPFDGKNYLEDCTLSCLKLVERSLQMERQFLNEFSASGKTIIITGLSKLLFGTNPNTGKCDHVVSIGRLLGHASSLPCQAACAVSIVALAAHKPGVSNLLVHQLTADPDVGAHIRHGFVECLESDVWTTETEQFSTVRATKETILHLLHQCLGLAQPNLSHYLLGFELSRDVSQTTFNQPGVAGCPRTCLHSLISILDATIGPDRVEVEEDGANENLLEMAFCLLYSLCARPQTSAPVLKFLRENNDFLVRHINAIPPPQGACASVLSRRAWVLRACACELGSAAARARSAPLAALVSALAGQALGRTLDGDTTWTQLENTIQSESCRIRCLLEGLPMYVEPVTEPVWEFFDPQQLRVAIDSCEHTAVTSAGVVPAGKRINVAKLHTLLARELGALQASAPQRGPVDKEIQNVLEYVTLVNKQRNMAASIIHYYDSWRQLTEILFCVAPSSVLRLEARQSLLVYILQDVLNKVTPAEVIPYLGNLASGTVLLLLVNLRHCYMVAKSRSALKSLREFETTLFGTSERLMQSYSLSLKFLLQRILTWLLTPGATTQKIRVNIYGALLNYLHIINLYTRKDDLEVPEIDSTFYVSRLDSSKVRISSRDEISLKSMVVDVVSGFGEGLCTVVCSDCIGASHEVCKMVALSCLEALIEINPHTDWINILSNRGYLRSLIDSLLQDDAGLKQVLEPSPKTLKSLYVYESKMSLLNKIASSRTGAESVLQHGALACLANMTVLDCHPDVQTLQYQHGRRGVHDMEDFVPSVSDRYQQILVPALALCSAVLTTLGTDNHSCLLHVTHALLSHSDALEMVLRAANPLSPYGLLVELEAITSILARASNRETFAYIEADVSLKDSAVILHRIQSLMLSLVGRFAPSVELLKKLAEPIVDSHCEEESDRIVKYFKISSNLMTYVRNVTREDGRGGTRVLFKPHLQGRVSTSDRTPDLGVLVRQLEYTVAHYHKEKIVLDTLNKRLREAPDNTLTDVAESEVQRLSTKVTLKRSELSHCGYVAENCLYMIWIHLDFYMLRTIPENSVAIDRTFNDSFNKSMTPSGAIYKSCAPELAELKRGLVSVFNDTFTKQLIDTAFDNSPTTKGLIETLVRKIKGLIQFVPV